MVAKHGVCKWRRILCTAKFNKCVYVHVGIQNQRRDPDAYVTRDASRGLSLGSAIPTWWEFLPTSIATRMWGPIGAPPVEGCSSRPSRLPRRATAPMGRHHSGGRPWMQEEAGAAFQVERPRPQTPRATPPPQTHTATISLECPFTKSDGRPHGFTRFHAPDDAKLSSPQRRWRSQILPTQTPARPWTRLLQGGQYQISQVYLERCQWCVDN